MKDIKRKIIGITLGLSAICLIGLSIPSQLTEIRNENNERLNELKNIYTKMDSISDLKNPSMQDGLTYLKLMQKDDSIYNTLPKDYQMQADSMFIEILK